MNELDRSVRRRGMTLWWVLDRRHSDRTGAYVVAPQMTTWQIVEDKSISRVSITPTTSVEKSGDGYFSINGTKALVRMHSEIGNSSPELYDGKFYQVVATSLFPLQGVPHKSLTWLVNCFIDPSCDIKATPAMRTYVGDTSCLHGVHRTWKMTLEIHWNKSQYEI